MANEQQYQQWIHEQLEPEYRLPTGRKPKRRENSITWAKDMAEFYHRNGWTPERIQEYEVLIRNRKSYE